MHPGESTQGQNSNLDARDIQGKGDTANKGVELTELERERLKEADKKYFEMGEHKIPLRKRKRDVFVRYDFNEMKEIG